MIMCLSLLSTICQLLQSLKQQSLLYKTQKFERNCDAIETFSFVLRYCFMKKINLKIKDDND